MECPGATVAFWGPHFPRILTDDYTFNVRPFLNIFEFTNELAKLASCEKKSLIYSDTCSQSNNHQSTERQSNYDCQSNNQQRSD